ncbi:MAG: excinuclease ABC subunit UvrB, partial [Nanoarchaeota archaeon]|nr:excinuclease ABC subunit UvrB [Nanoarchaeota archaeon]
NPLIERMRLSTTTSLLTRKDTIVVASVSCIYGLGNPENYKIMGFEFSRKQKISRKEVIEKLLSMQYERNDFDLVTGKFRVRGNTIDVIPGNEKDILRIEMNGNEISEINFIDKASILVKQSLDYYYLFPARHFVIPEQSFKSALDNIEAELRQRLPNLEPLESHRLKQRTLYDLEMIRNIGYCKGIENYSRHFDGRKEGEKPYCLLDYFGDDFLIFIDESHQTIPQLHAMYKGDRQRKQVLVDFGFRLPSALDNRPLKFREFEEYMKKQSVIFVSATPADYEKESSKQIAEQIIRPTGLLDPKIEIKTSKNYSENLVGEIEKTIERGDRILVTTLTKNFAEELSDFFASKGIKTRYLHSEIKTFERSEIIRELRIGKFDVLVGINLLREGLDIPEVGLVAILDADKEGFLRDQQSLIQTIGRAARNVNAKVILYADKMTDSIKGVLEETNRRREIQMGYNKKNNITPTTIKRPIEEQMVIVRNAKHIPKKEKERLIPQIEKEMRQAAENLDFELAIELREQLRVLRGEKEGKEEIEEI